MAKDNMHERLRVGLCLQCRHVRQIVSERGSIFYLCQRSAQDPSFPKYPKLPMLSCRGYEKAEADLPDEEERT